jgi:hypothetical protein
MDVAGLAAKWWDSISSLLASPYGNRTRVTAVKEKRFTVIQRNFAAWIALYRTSKTHGNCYWTFNGRAFPLPADRAPISTETPTSH